MILVLAEAARNIRIATARGSDSNYAINIKEANKNPAIEGWRDFIGFVSGGYESKNRNRNA